MLKAMSKEESEEPQADVTHALRQIFFWRREPGSSFYHRLIELFIKADKDNYNRLAEGFPAMAMAIAIYQASDDPEKLFEEFGI